MSTNKSQSKSTRGPHKLRARTTPKWIAGRQDLDEMARRRCLMVLSVLSGERAVTEVIAEAQISRGTYYTLEERALCAMIAALAPQASEESASVAESPAKRIVELEAKVTKLEREKRRGERLLFLTRKIVKPGSMKMAAGRPSKKSPRRASTTTGPTPSRVSKTAATTTERASPSTPTPDGEDER